MTQPINTEQCLGDDQLAEPGALFVPEAHDPTPIEEMAAYKVFLMGLPQSYTTITTPI